MAIKSSNYIVIFGWMCNELELKGNELLVYALIYGFSQDGESAYTGGRKYIADTLNISLPTVDKALNNLVSNGFIEKLPFEVNSVVFNHYKISLGVVKKLYGGSKETLPYNKVNNKIEFNTSKDILNSEKSGFEFGKKKTNSKTNLYSQCESLINNFISQHNCGENIRRYLSQYLKYRISIKEKPLYLTMWQGMLDKLEELHKQGYTYETIIRQSIEKGWLSFYEVKSNRARLSEPTEGTGCEQATEADDAKRGEFIRGLREQGKRADF